MTWGCARRIASLEEMAVVPRCEGAGVASAVSEQLRGLPLAADQTQLLQATNTDVADVFQVLLTPPRWG